MLPIRIIRILCKTFGDPFGSVVTDKVNSSSFLLPSYITIFYFTLQEVLVPYPCVKVLEDKFELYLDYCLITKTTSCAQAFILLMALYDVFEIRFAHHHRCCRLLYAVIFEDSHYLNKPLRTLLKNWNYTIINRLKMTRHVTTQGSVGTIAHSSRDIQNMTCSSPNSDQMRMV